MNCVRPGIIDTPMNQELSDPDFRNQISNIIPMKREGETKGMISFLFIIHFSEIKYQ